MIEIIPAIDVIDGQCVRLSEGDYSRRTVYQESPSDVSKKFAAAGIQRLHLVDLDGAKAGAVKNLAVLELISRNTHLRIDFGGGIKSEADVEAVISAGATYVTVGSMVVRAPGVFHSWIAKYTAERFFIGADVRQDKIAISGWLEQTEIDVMDFLKQQMSNRVHYFFCTDISRDGLLEGPSENLYRRIIAQCPGIRLVASGGVSSMDDIYRLEEIGCQGVIVGKALYENRISLKEIEKYNARTAN